LTPSRAVTISYLDGVKGMPHIDGVKNRETIMLVLLGVALCAVWVGVAGVLMGDVEGL